MSDSKSERKVFGRGSRQCFRCGNNKGLIRRYNLDICRRCFREVSKELGFRKY